LRVKDPCPHWVLTGSGMMDAGGWAVVPQAEQSLASTGRSRRCFMWTNLVDFAGRRAAQEKVIA
jgi:hypothetical protein